MDMKIAVLGAGVVGLNTALHVQEQFPSSEITLVSEYFNENTLSYKPAGIFRPGTSFAGPTIEVTREWIAYSYEYYKKLQNLTDTGVTDTSGYIFSNIDENITKNHYLQKLLPIYRNATDAELHMFGNSWKYGCYYETMLIQGVKFLPWALNRFKSYNDGRVKELKVTKITDLKNDFDVVFNCTGLGAKYLCDDHQVVPIRGQIVKVHAPLIKKFYYNDYDTYVFPLGDGNVALGGCRNYDSYDTNVNEFDSASILKRCSHLVPSLKEARVVSEWVGLRPHRSQVRVELQKIDNLKVIHNYGHSGYGITSAPGTALSAVKELTISHLSNSRL